MMTIEFRHLSCNERFEFEGQVYTKTSHRRGFYHKEGRTLCKRFKKNKLVKRIIKGE